jgi:hypothetical protein
MAGPRKWITDKAGFEVTAESSLRPVSSSLHLVCHHSITFASIRFPPVNDAARDVHGRLGWSASTRKLSSV